MIGRLWPLHARRRHLTEWHHRAPGPITEEKLARAVHILADMIEEHGPTFRPLYHDLRQQLAELRSREQTSTAAASRAAHSESKVA